jgi:hypothetical protein
VRASRCRVNVDDWDNSEFGKGTTEGVAERLRFDFVLKGRGFQPRRKSAKSIRLLAAEVRRSRQIRFSAV